MAKATAEETAAVAEQDPAVVDVSEIKMPFSVRKFRELRDDYIRRNNIDAKDFDDFRFIREQGLPNPTRVYRVSPFIKGGKESIGEPKEIEAVDSSEAIQRYRDSAKGDNAERIQSIDCRFETSIVSEG